MFFWDKLLTGRGVAPPSRTLPAKERTEDGITLARIFDATFPPIFTKIGGMAIEGCPPYRPVTRRGIEDLSTPRRSAMKNVHEICLGVLSPQERLKGAYFEIVLRLMFYLLQTVFQTD